MSTGNSITRDSSDRRALRRRQGLERRPGFALAPEIPEGSPADVYRDHVGVHPQKEQGLVYAGLAVLRGRITPEALWAVADAAERDGTGDIRTTSMQNLLVLNIPRERAAGLARDVEAARLRLEASPYWRGTIACTGTEFCEASAEPTRRPRVAGQSASRRPDSRRA